MLKSRRKELKMTLQDLAEKSGLSAPFISQAERNQTIPSMVSLVKLSQALDVDVKYFMEVPHDDSIVHRAGELTEVEMDSPVTYYNMSSDLTNQQMDSILMVIPPGHEFPVDQRDGEDLLYVLEGELYAEVGDVKTTLKAGDSMHFNSNVPHTAVNQSDKDVKLLYVGTPSIF
ncbi:helix-turn-helix domain-containing protein [Pseudomaricurvus alkylphenolicus]|uniref:helix-turn-helix domain-containing protein n=1 Tax=Pseudomaricurvus alkylphenolicus TaxID=1306991 RepID=UPI0023F61E06|nr:XRE family transcriptional regulator [Pseudomaricurvus alkylphenolicus]